MTDPEEIPEGVPAVDGLDAFIAEQRKNASFREAYDRHADDPAAAYAAGEQALLAARWRRRRMQLWGYWGASCIFAIAVLAPFITRSGWVVWPALVLLAIAFVCLVNVGAPSALAALRPPIWPWGRWEAVIVGELSGNVTRLTFVRFRTEKAARAWVARANQEASAPVHFEYREIEAGR